MSEESKIIHHITNPHLHPAKCGCRPGMTLDETTVTQFPDGSWKAVSPIGSLFGSEVQGECYGTGSTREEAMAALKKNQDELYESIWI